MNLIVLCAGGHARVVIEALRSRGIRPAAVMDREHVESEFYPSVERPANSRNRRGANGR